MRLLLLLFIVLSSFNTLLGQISPFVKEAFKISEGYEYTCSNIKLPSKAACLEGNEFVEKKVNEYITYFLTTNGEGVKQALDRWKNYTLSNNIDSYNIRYYLALSLSGLKPNSVNENNRTGIYQFSFPIAASYGILMNENIDERRSTEIEKTAIEYLTFLKDKYPYDNDIILAFSNGEAALNKAKKRGGSDSLEKYYSYLPESTRDAFFVYLALKSIISNTVFGEKIEQISELETIHVDKQISFKALKDITAYEEEEFKKNNTIVVSNIIPVGDWKFPYSLNLKLELDTLYFYQDSIMNNPNYGKKEIKGDVELKETFYRVKKGENLLMISEWYDVSVEDIKNWNKLRSDKVSKGQVLKLWVDKTIEFDLSKINYLAISEKNNLLNHTSYIEILKEFEYYTVIKGDILYLIAKKYKGVSADDIMRWNGISPNIQPGQKILIRSK